MNRVCLLTGSVCIAMATALVCAAQAPALDVRMGLWEVTNVATIGGAAPQIDLSKMPPEQRAKMEAAIKGMMGTHTSVSKSCITKEKLEKSVFMMDDEPGQKCTQALSTNTPSTLEATVRCTGTQPMTGQMHLDALSPTSVKGTMKSEATEQGRSMTISMALTGKWLGADCGSTK
jgi:uncharacterized protein DUF3617